MAVASWLVACLALWMYADRSLFPMLRHRESDEDETEAEGTSSGVDNTDGDALLTTLSQVVEMGSEEKEEEEPEEKKMQNEPEMKMEMEMEMDKKTGLDMCDVDYVIGEDACHCKDKAHELILQEEMCIQAAREAGVTVPKRTFRIEPEFFHMYPKGCFKSSCREDKNGCYFFNPIASPPAFCQNKKGPKVKGVPVCKRAKFLEGTRDTNDRCPKGYAALTTEDSCSEAGQCLGFCEGKQFRQAVRDASQHHEYPQGCFIHAEDFCLYFNPRLKGWREPKHPKGTQICAPTSVTKN